MPGITWLGYSPVTTIMAGVEHALRNAIAWAPNWFRPHWTLAQVLALTDAAKKRSPRLGRPWCGMADMCKNRDLERARKAVPASARDIQSIYLLPIAQAPRVRL